MYENFVIGYLFSVVLLVALAVLICIVTVIHSVISGKKTGNYSKLRCNILSLVFILVMVVSWFSNFGMKRLVLTAIALPASHSILFYFANNFAAGHFFKSVYLKILTIMSYVTYISAYILFPDGDGDAFSYAVFSLVNNEFYISLFVKISVGLFAANIVLMILQVVQTIRVKYSTTKRRIRRKSAEGNVKEDASAPKKRVLKTKSDNKPKDGHKSSSKPSSKATEKTTKKKTTTKNR